MPIIYPAGSKVIRLGGLERGVRIRTPITAPAGGSAPSVGTGVAPALYLHFGYGVTLNGSTIASVVDQSANAFSFAQATTGLQPTLVANAHNSKAAARFTGAQYLVASGVLSALNTAAFTIMVVGTNTDTSGPGGRRAFDNRGSSTGYGIGEDTSFRWSGNVETYGQQVGIAAADTNIHAVFLIGQTNGANSVAGDTTTLTGAGASTRAVNTATAPVIGGDSIAAGSNLWKGDLCGIVVWPTNLGLTDRTAALTFARSEWGTP